MMYSITHLLLSVVCVVTLIIAARCEPLPSESTESSEDTEEVHDEGKSDETEYTDGDYEVYDASHYSTCLAGYEGRDCATVTDNCARKETCLNGAICVNEINNYSCICTEKFSGRNCEYLKNCQYPGTCAPLSNAENCDTCVDGFIKDPEDATRCEYANTNNASLLVTFSRQIRMISLDGQLMGNPIDFDATSNFNFYRGGNYDLQTKTVFWNGGSKSQIFAAPITHEPGDKIVLHNAAHFKAIYSLAVDWIYEHLYFIDTTDDFFVCSFNGKIKRRLNVTVASESIAVNPLQGWVYWTSGQSGPNQIQRMGMDGSQREVIANTFLDRPEGLVIDLLNSRLYWSQGRDPSSIWSSDLNGFDLKLLFRQNQFQSSLNYIWKIATFDKYIYMIELSAQKIYRVNKCGGDEEMETVFVSEFHQDNALMYEIKVFDPTAQPQGENLCSKRTEKCSQFCFPVPNNGSVSTTCACSDGFSLSADQQTCVQNPTA